MARHKWNGNSQPPPTVPNGRHNKQNYELDTKYNFYIYYNNR